MTIYRNGEAIVLTDDELEDAYREREVQYHAEDIISWSDDTDYGITDDEVILKLIYMMIRLKLSLLKMILIVMKVH